jgi:hypothetical protein
MCWVEGELAVSLRISVISGVDRVSSGGPFIFFSSLLNILLNSVKGMASC